MAGYGNRTASSTSPSDLAHEHSTTRLGLLDSNTAYHDPHEKHGSGITGGAGFGNKRSSLTSTSTTDTLTSTSIDTSTTDHTAPYSHGTAMGSGSTGGAGYGNKTGEMGGPTRDSGLGKLVMKVGGVVGSERVQGVGKGLREREGWSGDGDHGE